MAGLVSLGQPFGGPSRIINVPAPRPSPFGQAIERGAGQIGQAIGMRGQRQQEQADQQRFSQAFGILRKGQGSPEAATAAVKILGGVQSPGWKPFVRQLYTDILARELDPSGQRQTEAATAKILAETQVLRREPQRPGFTLTPGAERFTAAGEPIAQVPPAAPLPSQQISARKLKRMDELQSKVDAGTATKKEEGLLDKMLAGAPLVEIGLGMPASAAERTAIAETRASLDALDNLKSLFDNPRTQTGPIFGRVAPVKGLAGLTTDEQEAFMAATSAFKNKVIKEITGAQMSETEAKRIMKQIPDTIDPPARWRAKWEQTRKNLQFIQKRRSEVLRQSGLRVPADGALDLTDQLRNGVPDSSTFDNELRLLDEQIRLLESEQTIPAVTPRTGMREFP